MVEKNKKDLAWKKLIGFIDCEGQDIRLINIPMNIIKDLIKDDRLQSATNLNLEDVFNDIKTGITFSGDLVDNEFYIDEIIVPKNSKINARTFANFIVYSGCSTTFDNADGSLSLIWE